jgi:hypothetical protein
MADDTEILARDSLTQKVTPKNFKYIVNNSLLGFQVNDDFETIIDDIHSKVNTGHYHPMRPVGVYSIPKHNLVPRFIPVLTATDNLLYHYLVKEIEESLLATKPKSVKTFGAYRVLTTAKKKDNDRRKYDFIDIDDISVGKYTVSYSWFPSWGEFNETVKNYFDRNKKKTVFVKTDVANFYDNIDLRLLENKVRSCLDDSKLSVVNILFKLLQGVNSFSYKYNYQGKGLPQDETSDCSRLLANYFLYDFDKEFDAICKKLDCTYVRYCDDIIVMCNDKASAEKIVHAAAEVLNKSALSLNSSKTKIFDSRSKFEKYWMFDEHNQMSANVKNMKKQKVYDEIQKLVLSASKKERGFPLVKRWARLYDSTMKNNPRLKKMTDNTIPHLSVDVASKYIKAQTTADKTRLLNRLYNKSRKSNYSGDLLWFRKVCELLSEQAFINKIDKYIAKHPALR